MPPKKGKGRGRGQRPQVEEGATAGPSGRDGGREETIYRPPALSGLVAQPPRERISAGRPDQQRYVPPTRRSKQQLTSQEEYRGDVPRTQFQERALPLHVPPSHRIEQELPSRQQYRGDAPPSHRTEQQLPSRQQYRSDAPPSHRTEQQLPSREQYRGDEASHMQFQERASPSREPRHSTQPQLPVPRKQVPTVPAVTAATEALAITQKPSSQKYHMARRPGFGKEGKPIQLEANYFILKYKDIDIYHYDVDIIFVSARRKDAEQVKGRGLAKKGKSLMEEGRTAREAIEKGETHLEHQVKRISGKQRCREVVAAFIKSESLRQYCPVYDGQKNIYTNKQLPIKKKTTYRITIDEDDRYKDFDIAIQPVVKQNGSNIINIEPLRQLIAGRNVEIPQEVIMAFDTVMCHRDPPHAQIQVGRSFFLLNQKFYEQRRLIRDLGPGVEIWYGYNQSVHLTQRGPAVIVNFSAKAFHKAGSVITYANELLNKDITKLPVLDRRDIKLLDANLSKVKVQVTHLSYPRKYPVKSVTDLPASELSLNIDGRDTTVAQYFREKYKPLRYPRLPCLHMRGVNKTTYIPLEVCEIVPNQPKLGKLSPTMTSNMIRQTAQPPSNRFEAIKVESKIIQDISGSVMKEFGLEMDVNFMKLKGRVIAPPALLYKAASERERDDCQPDKVGKWHMGGKHFFNSSRPGVSTLSWILISFLPRKFCDERKLDKFAKMLSRSARALGMELDEVRDIRIYDRRVSTRRVLDAAKEANVTFCVVVLSPNDPDHSYEELKFVADIKLRMLTQCMTQRSINICTEKNDLNIVNNILLKINSKIGGTNHIFKDKPFILTKPVIIFGADAAHSPRGYRCPSIAAVVGSLDPRLAQYAVSCRTQENPDDKKISQEIIIDLKEMVKQVLKEFKKNTKGATPLKVIFFRDGVSEGQFSTVLEDEVEKVQRACCEELGGFVPPLTYIVVQKRHQTRFRTQNPKEGVGKMFNVPPGTTVDTDVTHPVFFDFFLCSHEGIQGTSKPAHYTVLFDENGFSADELQKLCYHLCYLYARCNRSISIPPPVMYAHLACARAKKYADWAINNDTASSVSSEEQKLPPEVDRAINEVGICDPGGMFYV